MVGPVVARLVAVHRGGGGDSLSVARAVVGKNHLPRDHSILLSLLLLELVRWLLHRKLVVVELWRLRGLRRLALWGPQVAMGVVRGPFLRSMRVGH